MKIWNKIGGILLLVVAMSCGNSAKNNPNLIKVGITAGPEKEGKINKRQK